MGVSQLWGRGRLWLVEALGRPEHLGNLALVQALLIGALVGVTTVVFRGLLGLVGTWAAATRAQATGDGYWLLSPLIGLAGGLVAGWLTVHVAPEAHGSGIPQLKDALVRPHEPLRRRAIVVKLLGAAAGIGAGLSLGREGPTIQIGGGIGEWVSRWLPHSRHERRTLLAAGGGAGLAAAFNAPIAGFVFIIEELLQDFSSRTLSTGILATLTASILSRSLAGNFYSFTLPRTAFRPAELPFYLVLGVLAGGTGLLFTRGLLAALNAMSRLRRLPRAWHPALVGLLTGLVGLVLPAVLGGSHDLTEAAFYGRLSVGMLATCFVVKFGLTLLAYGSGAPGGIFAPILVLGALLGAGVGWLAQGLTGGGLPMISGLAFVGMGALFTAIVRAPLTAMIIVFEMTGNYEQVLPLMAACVTANLTAHFLKGVPVYDALAARGGEVGREPVLPPDWQHVAVGRIMSRPVECLPADATLQEVTVRFARSPHSGFPVTSDGRLVGIVTRSDWRRATELLSAAAPVTAWMESHLITVTGADTLETAWQHMVRHAIGRLIVVAADDPTRVVGILTRSDLVWAGLGRPDQPAA